MKEVKLTAEEIQIIVNLLYQESEFKQGERWQRLWDIIEKIR